MAADAEVRSYGEPHMLLVVCSADIEPIRLLEDRRVARVADTSHLKCERGHGKDRLGASAVAKAARAHVRRPSQII